MNINGSDKILIVAPHADDESIGAGGFLSTYGKQCDVWLVTDGRKGNSPDAQYTDGGLVAARENEFKQVMDFFHVHDYAFLGLTDGNVSLEMAKIYHKSIKAYDYIFVPNQHEAHPDHAAVYKAIMKMKKKQKAKGDIVEYEVWTPLLRPNVYLPVTTLITNKLKAVSFYESQLKTLDYVSLAESLSRYRGFASDDKYREAYFSHKQAYVEKRDRFASSLPKPVSSVICKIKSRLKSLSQGEIHQHER